MSDGNKEPPWGLFILVIIILGVVCGIGPLAGLAGLFGGGGF